MEEIRTGVEWKRGTQFEDFNFAGDIALLSSGMDTRRMKATI